MYANDASPSQVQMLKSSLARAQTDLSAARHKVLDCEKAKLSAEKYYEGVAQRSRVELADARLEAQRQRVEVEKQRDDLAFQVQGEFASP